MEKKKSIVYVDGFNLYYGSLKGTRYKWLDIQKYFTLLRSDDDIIKVKYFTAKVWGASSIKQEIYFQALKTLPKIEIILGRFKNKKVKCLVEECMFADNKWFPIPEEKRTDVNIATQMMYDAVFAEVERMILVSGDSDLLSPLVTIKRMKPTIKIIVYIPDSSEYYRNISIDLRSAADKIKVLPNSLFEKAQFTDFFNDEFGEEIIKPADW